MKLRWGLLFLVMICGVRSAAQTYDELAELLSKSKDKAETHRIKSQLAKACVEEVEAGIKSKATRSKRIKEAFDYCSDVQLGAMDYWFGESVVTWARLLLVEGDRLEARAILLDQVDVLQGIEKNLLANKIAISSVSPVAGCRYILGETYRLEYEETNSLEAAAEAFRHYYNVHIKYGDSIWGPLASDRAEVAKLFLEKHGKRVKVDLGKNKGSMIANKFKFGARLMSQGKFEEAIEQYLVALNYFPETSAAPEALRNLAFCYLEQEDDARVRMVVEYLCERFRSQPEAASMVLHVGYRYLKKEDRKRGEAIFQQYLTAFPLDAQVSEILLYFGWKAYAAEKWTDAASYFGRVVELNNSVDAAYARADCMMKQEEWSEAHSLFKQAEVLIRDADEADTRLEKVLYFQGYCSKDMADYDRFLEAYPYSELAPRVLSEKAQSQLVAECFSDAFETLAVLSDRFPDAPSTRRALANLILAAVENKRFDIATQVLDEMLVRAELYGDAVYISTGETLLEAGAFELAEKAFSAVSPDAESTWLERSKLGMARVLFAQDKWEDCLESLAVPYAKGRGSAFYDVCLLRARSLAGLGKESEAVEAFGEVLSMKQDYAISFELAELLTDPEAKLAAYQRIAWLADRSNTGEKRLMIDSLIASIPLCKQEGRWSLLIENYDQLKKLSPKHKQLTALKEYREEAQDALGL